MEILIPPWQVWALEFGSFVGLIAYQTNAKHKIGVKNLILLAAVLTALITATVGIIFDGYGMTWNVSSLIGKVAATYIALGVPVFGVVLTLVLLSSTNQTVYLVWLASMIVGVVLIFSTTLIGVILVCGFTGDCL